VLSTFLFDNFITGIEVAAMRIQTAASSVVFWDGILCFSLYIPYITYCRMRIMLRASKTNLIDLETRRVLAKVSASGDDVSLETTNGAQNVSTDVRVVSGATGLQLTEGNEAQLN
jgi:hypothetical protein